MFLKILDKLEEVLIAFLIGAATLIVFAAVLHRYTLDIVVDLVAWARAGGYSSVLSASQSAMHFLQNINLTWAQELTIYMFVWMAKFGAAYGVRTGIHVGVDVLVNRLSPPIRNKTILFGLLCGALFTGIVGILGGAFVFEIAHTDQVSADLEMPMWLVYLAVPCGSALMCFRFLQVAWNFLKTGELPHHDHGHVDGLDDVEVVR